MLWDVVHCQCACMCALFLVSELYIVIVMPHALGAYPIYPILYITCLNNTIMTELLIYSHDRKHLIYSWNLLFV